MVRTARAGAGLLLFLASISASLTVAGGASASARCGEKVLSDWADDGRVDGVYPLRCYQEALARMPPDLRDYTNASDAINRALTRAVSSVGDNGLGKRVAAGASPATDRATAVPLPLILLVGISVAVLSAGVLGHLVRRRRTPGS